MAIIIGLTAVWLNPRSASLAEAATTNTFDYFPWPVGTSAVYTGGPHAWDSRNRSGVDFSTGLTSTRILSMADGDVTFMGDEPQCDGGSPCWAVHITQNGYEVRYLHLSSFSPELKARFDAARAASSSATVRVARGNWIGNEGNSGVPLTNGRRAIHLHLELLQNGHRVGWDGKSIAGWTFHASCVGYEKRLNRVNPADSCTTDPDYNGFISTVSDHALPEVGEYPQLKLPSMNRETPLPPVSPLDTTLAPSKPAWLTANANSTFNVRLRWENVASETGYEINDGVTTRSTSVDVFGYDWGGFAPNTYKCFTVRAVNAAGKSPWTPWSCTSTLAAVTQPSTPTGVTATAESTSRIRLNWGYSGPTVSGFRFYEAGHMLVHSESGGNVRTTTLNALAAGTRHCYTVRAVTSTGGESPNSAQACATTPSNNPTPVPPPTVAPSGRTEVIVDDRSGGFTRGGTGSYWRESTIGYSGHMYYTWNRQSQVDNWGKWTPQLNGGGNYEVFVFVPRDNATTTKAGYRIHHNGTNSGVYVNQNQYSDAWVSLGTHYFNDASDEYVFMGDETFETSSTKKIGFDAMKFVPR